MQTMITAHSGSDGTPDNSMEYIRYALTCQADAFEVDVHANRRGEFYISHDSATGECPELREVFSLMGTSKKKLNCDLKEENIEREVLELAKRYGVAERIILTGSVSPKLLTTDPLVRACTLLNLECAVPELAERYRSGSMPTAGEVAAAAKACQQCGAEVVNVHFPICTEENLAAFRACGIGVSAWTVNDRRDALRLLRAKLYNLTTRAPALLCALRDC